MKVRINSLNLNHSRKKVYARWGWVPFVDLVLMIICFFLLRSAFFFAPGVSIQLPNVSEKIMLGRICPYVLTVTSNNIIFFNGEIYDITRLNRMFLHLKIKNERANLLIKASKYVDIQTLMQICEEAKKVGFANVQIAANVVENE